MEKKEGVMATDVLRQVIERWPPAEHDHIFRMVEGRTAEFLALYKSGRPTEFVKAFYEVFDETLADQKALVSCRKGCHFCCHQNVQIFPDEAAYIAEHCGERGIPIPKAQLEEQLKYGWKEVAKTDAGWCVFLKDGECSIYEARPLGCRKYLVASSPELCDTVKYPSDEGYVVSVVVLTVPEMEASAFMGVMSRKGKAGRLPQLLLPYSK